jgi:integrase
MSSSSIAKRDNGKWRARYRDDAGREHARHFDRKVDAQRWLDEVTAAIVTGMYVAPAAGKVTLTQFHEQWAQRQVWEKNTTRAVSLSVRGATFADLPLAQVRRSHVEAWIKTMSASGLAAGTVKTRFNNVRAVLRAAVADRVIATDPTIGVALPRERRKEAAMTLPTAKQVAALLEGAPSRFRGAIGLAAFGGLRLGEIGGVQVGDVDFLRGVVSVTRQVQRLDGGGYEVRAPKYGSERQVYIPRELVELLAEHVAAHRPGDDPSRWLFASASGGALAQNSLDYLWRQTCKAAKVEGLTLHDLRHYYASGLIAAGCDVVTVQRALGHAKATTTLNTYAHLWPKAEDRTRKAAASMMAEVGAAADSVRTAEAVNRS